MELMLLAAIVACLWSLAPGGFSLGSQNTNRVNQGRTASLFAIRGQRGKPQSNASIQRNIFSQFFLPERGWRRPYKLYARLLRQPLSPS